MKFQVPLGLIFLMMGCDHNSDSAFEKVISLPINSASSVTATRDGGFIIAASTSAILGNEDLFAIKCNAEGVQEWGKTFGGQLFDRAASIIQSSDGNYILSGSLVLKGGNSDFYLVKMTLNGTQIWSRTIGGPRGEIARTLMELPNKDILVGGYTNSFGAGDRDMYLVSLSADGETLWTKTYGSNLAEDAAVMTTTENSDIIIIGTQRNNLYETDNYAIRINSSGHTIWQKTTDLAGNDAPKGIIPLRNQDFIVCDGNGSLSILSASGKMALMNPPIANLTYNGICRGQKGYAVIGTQSDGLGNFSLSLTGISSSGAIEWTSLFGFPDAKGIAIASASRGFIAIGTTLVKARRGFQNCTYVVRTNNRGQL